MKASDIHIWPFQCNDALLTELPFSRLNSFKWSWEHLNSDSILYATREIKSLEMLVEKIKPLGIWTLFVLSKFDWWWTGKRTFWTFFACIFCTWFERAINSTLLHWTFVKFVLGGEMSKFWQKYAFWTSSKFRVYFTLSTLCIDAISRLLKRFCDSQFLMRKLFSTVHVFFWTSVIFFLLSHAKFVFMWC